MSELPLAQRSCRACAGNSPRLTGEQIVPLLQELGDEWRAIGTERLQRTFRFKNFADALTFTNTVGAIAESEGHHPNIFLTWGRVALEIWTHKIDALSEADFILAAKCEAAYQNLQK